MAAESHPRPRHPSLPHRLIALACLWLVLALPAAARAGEPAWSHGLSLFGPLKYPADFTHFDYVDPTAPKGGTLSRGMEGTFDSLNPFILKGVAPDESQELSYESLLESSADEPDAAYGLIAERVALADDRRSVRFQLRAEARFHDGSPLTAEWVRSTILKQIVPAKAAAAE